MDRLRAEVERLRPLAAVAEGIEALFDAAEARGATGSVELSRLDGSEGHRWSVFFREDPPEVPGDTPLSPMVYAVVSRDLVRSLHVEAEWVAGRPPAKAVAAAVAALNEGDAR